MGVNEGFKYIEDEIDVDVILENCSITIVTSTYLTKDLLQMET